MKLSDRKEIRFTAFQNRLIIALKQRSLILSPWYPFSTKIQTHYSPPFLLFLIFKTGVSFFFEQKGNLIIFHAFHLCM